MSTSGGKRGASTSTRAPRATPTGPSARATRREAVAERDRREALAARAQARRTLDALTRLEAARERNPNAYRASTKGIFSPGLERALATQARQIEGMGHERLTVHDPATLRTILTKEGTVDAIRLNANEVKQIAGRVEMHNHPQVTGHETTFSEDDIKGTISSKSAGTRVVTRQGTVTMTPLRTGRFKNGRWPSYGRTVGPAFTRHYDAISQALVDRIYSGAEPRGVNAIPKGELMHLAWRRAARDTGLRYSRRMKA
jgi:hypothetical protein